MKCQRHGLQRYAADLARQICREDPVLAVLYEHRSFSHAGRHFVYRVDGQEHVLPWLMIREQRELRPPSKFELVRADRLSAEIAEVSKKLQECVRAALGELRSEAERIIGSRAPAKGLRAAFLSQTMFEIEDAVEYFKPVLRVTIYGTPYFSEFGRTISEPTS